MVRSCRPARRPATRCDDTRRLDRPVPEPRREHERGLAEAAGVDAAAGDLDRVETLVGQRKRPVPVERRALGPSNPQRKGARNAPSLLLGRRVQIREGKATALLYLRLTCGELLTGSFIVFRKLSNIGKLGIVLVQRFVVSYQELVTAD